MKAHRVSGSIHWQDSHGWWHARIVPHTVVMADEPLEAITHVARLMFLTLPDETAQGAFYGEANHDGACTLETIRWGIL